ncbi:MAG: DUF123 domain-containing protein [Candidatus Nanohaloarchaea archaeon]
MKAVYALFVSLEDSRSIEIGALGEVEFEEGLYVYVGSAMNSVEKRLERHFSRVENAHWHIDYFTSEAEAVDYLVLPEDSEYECVLSEVMQELGEPVEGFGASDCSCDSHLYFIPRDC